MDDKVKKPQYLMDAEFCLKQGQFEEKVVTYDEIDLEMIGQINHMGTKGWHIFSIKAPVGIDGLVVVVYRREKEK